LAKFSNLNPQTYYITAILKEYEFDEVDSITIQEGEHKKLVFVAQRVAFSVYGQATTIIGRPFTFGTIIATEVGYESYRQE
jgi:hypothetical protein